MRGSVRTLLLAQELGVIVDQGRKVDEDQTQARERNLTRCADNVLAGLRLRNNEAGAYSIGCDRGRPQRDQPVPERLEDVSRDERPGLARADEDRAVELRREGKR